MTPRNAVMRNAKDWDDYERLRMLAAAHGPEGFLELSLEQIKEEDPYFTTIPYRTLVASIMSLRNIYRQQQMFEAARKLYH
jgi:hypothetical protein